MNTPLRRLAVVVVTMFVALIGSATWVQFVQAPTLNNDNRNVRTLYREYGNDRGPIVVGGDAVASSTPVDDPFGYLRAYADGPMYAPVTGYYSVVYGRSGIERTMNTELNGSADSLFYTRHEGPHHRAAAAGRCGPADHRPRGAAGGVGRARQPARRGGRDRPEHRRDPGAGLQAVLRPERAGLARHRRGQGRVGRAQRRPERADGQPGDRRRHLPAGLDLQARHRRRRARVRHEPGHVDRGAGLAAPAEHHGGAHQLRRREVQRDRRR